MDDRWQSVLVCPVDRAALVQTDDYYRCTMCEFTTPAKAVPDFRAVDCPQQVSVTFDLPVQSLDRYNLANTMFHAVNQQFDHLSRQQIRQQFGTKLDKGIQFYAQQVLETRGPDVPILDLGCGKGGNRRYLHSLGFNHVLTVDWSAAGADLLVDAHRLPLADGTFGMVISTAVFEHLYNPFIAMSEVSRVLDDEGVFVGGASFWEAWHGSSYFHMTPDGWNAVLAHNGMVLEDLWAGWGFLPAALYHVLTPGYLRRFGYVLQSGVEAVYRMAMGELGVRRLQLRASGSYQVFVRKQTRI